MKKLSMSGCFVSRVVGIIAFLYLRSVSCIAQECDSNLVIDSQFKGRCLLAFSKATLWMAISPDNIWSIRSATGRSFAEEIAAVNYEELITEIFDVELYNDSIGLIVGSGAKQQGGPSNRFVRTTDAGASWQEIPIGMEAAVDRIDVNERGEGWAIGDRGIVLYSDDFGSTWRKKGEVEGVRAACSFSMYDNGKGIVGSFDNSIAITLDGGRTWSGVPTPMDQQKVYEVGPNFNKIENVAIVGPFLLVQQRGYCFYSLIDSIAWERLIGNPVLFAASDDMRTAMIVDTLWQVRRIDSNLKLMVDSAVGMNSYPLAIATRKDEVRLMDAAGGIYGADMTAGHYIPPPSDKWRAESRDMDIVRGRDGYLWGCHGAAIYRLNIADGVWCRYGNARSMIKDFIPNDDGIVVFHKEISGAIFIKEDGSMAEVKDIAKILVDKIVDYDGSILAFGNRVLDNAHHAGENFRTIGAVLLLSRDRGSSWAVVNEKNGAIGNSFTVGPDGNSWLFFQDGEIRKISRFAPGSDSLIPFQSLSADRVPRGLFRMTDLFPCDTVGSAIGVVGAHSVLPEDHGDRDVREEKAWEPHPYGVTITLPSGMLYVSYYGGKLLFLESGRCKARVLVSVDDICGECRKCGFRNISMYGDGSVLIRVAKVCNPIRDEFWLYDLETARLKRLF